MKLCCKTNKKIPSRGTQTFESTPQKLVLEASTYSWKDSLIWPCSEFLQHLNIFACKPSFFYYIMAIR